MVGRPGVAHRLGAVVDVVGRVVGGLAGELGWQAAATDDSTATAARMAKRRCGERTMRPWCASYVSVL